MALITISGYPSSGKTYRADQLKSYFDTRLSDPSYDGPRFKVVVLSDHNLNIDRSVYGGVFWLLTILETVFYTFIGSDSRKEKTARATLFSAIHKEIGKDTLLIVDSINYIKGFRYQIYCAAREHRVRIGTVSASCVFMMDRARLCHQLFTLATADVCRERNTSRSADDGYSPET